MKQGWELIKLGEVAKVIYGYTEKASFKDIGPKFLRITDIQDECVNWDTVPYCKIIDADFEKYKLSNGDIVFARTGATTGKSYLVTNPPISVFASYLIKVHINDTGLSPDFLFLFFQTKKYWDTINAGVSGSAQGGFNASKLSGLEIPLPPLPEQQRIVAILEEAFAAIVRAKAIAEQNLKNAKELFESYLQSVFANKGEGWEEKTLGEVAEVEYGYTDNSTGEGYYRYVRITDIDKNGELILHDKKYIKHSKEAESFQLENNDLLMARTGATFAKVLLFKDFEPSVFASYLIRIKFKEKIENILYWYFTKTKCYWDQANRLSSGAAQPHFNGAAVKQVIFSYPNSVKEQKVLIEKFEALSAETKKLESIYKQKLNDLEELKKSMLQKAFNGELVGAVGAGFPPAL